MSEFSDAERDAEFEAMRKIDVALAKLPGDTVARVLRWACDKYRVTLPAAPGGDQ